MKVVLLEDVKALGKKGDIVEVSDGYARNFILPKKKGVLADAANLNTLRLQKENEQKIAEEKLNAAKSLKEEIEAKSVVVSMKAGADGRAFGSISSKDIEDAIKSQLCIDIDKKKIVIENPIKNFGKSEVKIKLHKDVVAALTVKIVEK